MSCFLIFQEVQSQVERICEMGQVMRRAVQVDDQHYCSVRERLAQLEVSANLDLWETISENCAQRLSL